MKVLITCLAVALVSGGCDRRAAQPLEESSTSDTLAAPVEVADSTAGGAPMQADTIPSAEPCLGLTGQSELDCIARNRDAGAMGESSQPLTPAASAETDDTAAVGSRAEPTRGTNGDGADTREPRP